METLWVLPEEYDRILAERLEQARLEVVQMLTYLKAKKQQQEAMDKLVASISHSLRHLIQ